MKNFRQWLTVDELGGKFAVVRREQWERRGVVVANAVMADGPFSDRAGAERARDLIEARRR